MIILSPQGQNMDVLYHLSFSLHRPSPSTKSSARPTVDAQLKKIKCYLITVVNYQKRGIISALRDKTIYFKLV